MQEDEGEADRGGGREEEEGQGGAGRGGWTRKAPSVPTAMRHAAPAVEPVCVPSLNPRPRTHGDTLGPSSRQSHKSETGLWRRNAMSDVGFVIMFGL